MAYETISCDFPSSTSPAEAAAFEADIERAARRYYAEGREPPLRSVCPFCPNQVFENVDSWENRMDHVGKHLENGDIDPADEKKKTST